MSQYLIGVMELECFKYKEKMKADEAYCKHPGDYCKYRTSCMIHFLSGENKRQDKDQEKTEKSNCDKDKSDSP